MATAPPLPDPAAARPAEIIAPGQARAVLAPLAASAEAGGAIDLPRLVQRIASGRPVDRLPRRPGFSPRRGAMLLLDCAEAMMPLRADVEGVAQRLLRLLGRERLALRYFAGCPARGAGTGERDTWRRDSLLPAPGVPIVLISDLGVTAPGASDDWAAPSEWLRFARQARAAGCPVVALVPYPLRRVAPALAQAFTLVPWTERLDAARVRRILHDALPRRRGD